jgi:hypothetical protein
MNAMVMRGISVSIFSSAVAGTDGRPWACKNRCRRPRAHPAQHCLPSCMARWRAGLATCPEI